MEFRNLEELKKHRMHLAHRILQQQTEVETAQRKLLSPITEYQKRQRTIKLQLNQLMYTAQASLAGFKAYKMLRNFIDQLSNKEQPQKHSKGEQATKSTRKNKEQSQLWKTILTALLQQGQ